jgi:hypothetical protein
MMTASLGRFSALFDALRLIEAGGAASGTRLALEALSGGSRAEWRLGCAWMVVAFETADTWQALLAGEQEAWLADHADCCGKRLRHILATTARADVELEEAE